MKGGVYRMLTYVKGEKRGYYGNDLLKHALHNTVPDITKTVHDEEGNDWNYLKIYILLKPES